jgi:hypothetical protein
LTTTDALIAAITVEGALFVAFSLAYALTQPDSEKGHHPFFAQAWFGWLVVAVMGVVAASAVADWHVLFGHAQAKGIGGWLQWWGLLIGVVAQPAIAGVVNWVAR